MRGRTARGAALRMRRGGEPRRRSMAKSVKVIFLGGVGEIGKNMTALEFGDDIIIVDCGVEFPQGDSPGIDAIIPDITYIRENRKKLRGIVLTHGHEDHIGALPYYADELNVPVYGTALTLGLLERKLAERGVKAQLNKVKEGDVVTLGCFEVEFIKVAHSMAGACALSVTTPIGVIFVTGDFKIDNTPIDGKKTDLQRIAEIGAKGVMLMLGESTNVERKGSSTSERVVGQGLENIFVANADKRIVVACFASSNYRVQQILWLAEKYGRKVVLAGRSMKGIVEVASRVGELQVPKGIIADGVGKLPPEKLVVIATGSQGEPSSALNRMSRGDFNKVSVGPIPGNEKSVYDVINNLFRKGANVIYEAMNEVHVSGHAYEEELKIMLSLVRPKFFMPVHGEYRHQFKHAEIAKSLGIRDSSIVIPNIGEVYGVNMHSVKQHSNVPAGNVYVDGVVLEDGSSVVSDRRSLAEYGMLLVLASVDTEKGVMAGDADVIARGFNLTDEIEKEIADTVRDTVNGSDFDENGLGELARSVKKAVRKLFYRDRQFPIIIPIIVED